MISWNNTTGSQINTFSGIDLSSNGVMQITQPVSLTTPGYSFTSNTGTGLCNTAPSDTTAPQIVQKQSAREGMSNVTVATTGGNTIVFSGLGRVTGAGITQLDFSNASGTCEHLDPAAGTMRCLRIRMSTGGQTKICDPKVTVATDPRFCI